MKLKPVHFFLIFLVGVFSIAAFTVMPFSAGSYGAVGYLVPSFGHAECVVLEPNHEFGPWPVPRQEKAWYCGSGDVSGNVKQCVYLGKYEPGFLNEKQAGDLKIYKCSDSGCDRTSSVRSSSYTEIDTLYSGAAAEYMDSVQSGQYLKTDGTGALSTYSDDIVSIKARADIYGIRTVYSDGRVERTISNYGCNIRALDKDDILESDVDSLKDNTIVFDQAINWIGGSTPVYDSANIISGSVVGTGGEIYVVATGSYYKVLDENTESGLKIVDSSRVFRSDAIECKPEATWCTNDAKLKEDFDPEGKECGPLRGVDPGWHPAGSGVVCTLKCVNGNVAHDDCKNIPSCASDEVLNQDYECVKIGEGVGPGEVPVPFKIPAWIWIPLFAALGGLIGFMAKKSDKMIAAIVGLILGALLGYLIFWFTQLALWQQVLFGIGGTLGASLLLYVLLFGGGLGVLAAFYNRIENR